MLTQDAINGIKNLLMRVQLQGQEVTAFNKIMLQLAAEEQELMKAEQDRQLQRGLPAGVPINEVAN